MFKEKFKENKKFRIQVISSVVAGIVVIACAVIIPVCVHNNNVKKALSEAETEITTTETTTIEETSATEQETTTVTETEPTTEVTTSETTTQKKVEKTTKKATSGGASTTKAQTTKKAPTADTPPANTRGEYDWTKEEVYKLQADAKAYARSTGHTVYPDNLFRVGDNGYNVYFNANGTEYKTGWDNSVETNVYKWSQYNRALESLKYQIDSINDQNSGLGFLCNNTDDNAGLGIVVNNCGSYWEIYVVY